MKHNSIAIILLSIAIMINTLTSFAIKKRVAQLEADADMRDEVISQIYGEVIR